MDFVFNCATCQGPLVARTALRGLRVQCAHCSGGIEVSSGTQVTDSVADAILDAPLPPTLAHHRILRRVRPAIRSSSAGASHRKPRLSRSVRITDAL